MAGLLAIVITAFLVNPYFGGFLLGGALILVAWFIERGM
jgi:hypothetical protein